MKKCFLLILLAIALLLNFQSCFTTSEIVQVDYSVITVPEEGAFVYQKITDETIENVAHPIVKKDKNKEHITFTAVNLLCFNPDGKSLFYIGFSNNQSNCFEKSVENKGVVTQRTFRSSLQDICLSPDGKALCFSEAMGDYKYLYLSKFASGAVIQQLSSQNVVDRHPRYTVDGNKIFFDRAGMIWSYDLTNGALNSYGRGYQPYPINNNEFICYRESTNRGEIWLVNYETGKESILQSMDGRWFITPTVSPDGKWVLCAANSIPKGNLNEENIDIYVFRTDGTQLTQLTYHTGNDICPIWSPDGKQIYFLSQRGTEKGAYNIWKMDFNL